MTGAGNGPQASRQAEAADGLACHRTFVVMELGATWPSWLGDSIADHGGSAVQVQASGEAPSEFAARVVQRIGGLSTKGRIQVGVLAWNSEVTAQALTARFRIARALIQAMNGEDGAELVISAAAGAADTNRLELLGLVAALCEDLSVAEVAVSLSFTNLPAKSRTVVRGSLEPWECREVAV